MMSQDVSSLEALRQRVEDATHGIFDGLDTLNATVNDIEARSAAALDTSQQALQVTTASFLSVSKYRLVVQVTALSKLSHFPVKIMIFPIFAQK